MKVILLFFNPSHPLVDLRFGLLSTKSIFRCPLFDIAAKVNLLRLALQLDLLSRSCRHILNKLLDTVLCPKLFGPDRKKPYFNGILLKICWHTRLTVQGVLNAPTRLLYHQGNGLPGPEQIGKEQAK